MPERKRIRVSHLTVAQLARFLEVKDPTVWERVHSGRLPHIVEYETTMIAADDCRRWWRDRLKARRRTAVMP